MSVSGVSLDHTTHVLPKEERLPALDSLRGLAALTVVFQHFHDMWIPGNAQQPPHWLRLAIVLLKPLWSGSESVLLFFVLSGFVLSIPLMRGKRLHYARYVLRRAIRIVGPYFVAITLAILVAAVFRDPGHRSSYLWPRTPQLSVVLQHYLFLGAYDTAAYNPVIWSLVHEMRISLIFPLLFFFVQRLGVAAAVAYAALSTIIPALFLSHTVNLVATSLCMTFHYSGMFAVGIVLAMHRDRLVRWWRELPSVVRGAGLLLTLALFSFPARIVGLAVEHAQHHVVFELSPVQRLGSDWLATVAAAGWILLALASRPVREFLLRPTWHLLGRASYSIYLVHLIVLYALTSTLAALAPLSVHFLLFVCLAIGAGILFSRWVEEPMIRLARSV